jgi:hypothetical protein
MLLLPEKIQERLADLSGSHGKIIGEQESNSTPANA